MKTLIPILAVASDNGLVHQLVLVLVIGICVLVVWWLGKYFIGLLEAPVIALKIWNGLFILLGGLCVINFLLSLIDKPFIHW